MLKFIDEARTSVVEEETTDTTESLSGQELDLGVGLVGVNETSRVNLNLLKVDGIGTNSHGNLVAVTSAVVTVGRREVVVFRAVLLKEGVLSEVGSVSTGGEDNGAVSGLGLTIVGVLDTHDSTRFVLDELDNTSLLQDLDALRVADSEVLETLHLGVGDDLGYGKERSAE